MKVKPKILKQWWPYIVRKSRPQCFERTISNIDNLVFVKGQVSNPIGLNKSFSRTSPSWFWVFLGISIPMCVNKIRIKLNKNKNKNKNKKLSILDYIITLEALCITVNLSHERQIHKSHDLEYNHSHVFSWLIITLMLKLETLAIRGRQTCHNSLFHKCMSNDTLDD